MDDHFFLLKSFMWILFLIPFILVYYGLF